MSINKIQTNNIQQQASYWVTRLKSEECSDADRYAFDVWLKQSEAHLVAYQQASAFWQNLAQIEPHAGAELEAARAYLRNKRLERRESYQKRRVAGLSILLVMLSSPFAWAWLTTQNYHTAKGEHASIQLSDGSQIELNTDTDVSVQYTWKARRVKLNHGEAIFAVEHNAEKPFTVAAADGIIEDVGTRFDVYQQDNKVSVTVLEGEVNVTTADNTTAQSLKPNQQLSYDNLGQPTPVIKVDTNIATAWQKKQLVFKAQPLSVVIEQLARYHDVTVQIADPGLQTLKVSGVFPSDNLQVALNTIAAALPIKITSTGATTYVIQAAGVH